MNFFFAMWVTGNKQFFKVGFRVSLLLVVKISALMAGKISASKVASRRTK